MGSVYPVAYEQNLDIGIVFDGLQPTNEDTAGHADAGVFDKGTFKVPHDSVNDRAGLFTFGHPKPLKVTQIDFTFGAGTTSWVLKRIRGADEFILLTAAAAGDFSFNETRDELPTLMVGDKLELTSIGVTTVACKATIYIKWQDTIG